MVAQPSTGFLNGHFYADGSPTEDTEDCLGRITVGLTRSKSLTIVVSPLDMIGLIGMAQVLATLAYGIKGLRRGISTWDKPYFHDDPQHENTSQMERWSLNQAPTWTAPHSQPPLQHQQPTCPKHAIQAHPCQSIQLRLAHSRQACNAWPHRSCQKRLASLGAYTGLAVRWDNPICNAADHSSRPTYVCLPSGLYHARSGRILQQSGPNQEVTPLPGIYFFDGWRVRPCMDIPTDLPRAQDPPEHDTQLPAATSPTAEPPQTPDEEARDILAKAIRNQAEDGPSTRRAAIRAQKYLQCHGPSTRPTAPEGIWGFQRTRHTQQRHPGILQIPGSTARTPCCPTATHVWAATLLVHLAWPQAPGQNHHQPGHGKSMGVKNGKTFFCGWVRSASRWPEHRCTNPWKYRASLKQWKAS